jgi:hypothetical protein
MVLINQTTSSNSFNIFNYCYPAILYFLYAFIKLLFKVYQKNNIYLILLKFLGILIWTYILNLLCTKGYTAVAWVLVLLPLAINFTLM